MSSQKPATRNQLATLYVGNLDERVTEALLWELFTQVGPLTHVFCPKDRITQLPLGFGFVEFTREADAAYALKIMNMVRLHGKPMRCNAASSEKDTLDVGATLFVGNLDSLVDEKLLYDTFSAFGALVSTPKVARDPETGASKGFGFVSYDNFDSSDTALATMNGQFLMNRTIHVDYAFKRDGKGERHGSEAERTLAAQARRHMAPQLPNRLFAEPPPPMAPMPPPPPMGVGMGHPPPPMGYPPHPLPPMMGHPPPPPYMMHPPPPPPMHMHMQHPPMPMAMPPLPMPGYGMPMPPPHSKLSSHAFLLPSRFPAGHPGLHADPPSHTHRRPTHALHHTYAVMGMPGPPPGYPVPPPPPRPY